MPTNNQNVEHNRDDQERDYLNRSLMSCDPLYSMSTLNGTESISSEATEKLVSNYFTSFNSSINDSVSYVLNTYATLLLIHLLPNDELGNRIKSELISQSKSKDIQFFMISQKSYDYCMLLLKKHSAYLLQGADEIPGFVAAVFENEVYKDTPFDKFVVLFRQLNHDRSALLLRQKQINEEMDWWTETGFHRTMSILKPSIYIPLSYTTIIVMFFNFLSQLFASESDLFPEEFNLTVSGVYICLFANLNYALANFMFRSMTMDRVSDKKKITREQLLYFPKYLHTEMKNRQFLLFSGMCFQFLFFYFLRALLKSVEFQYINRLFIQSCSSDGESLRSTNYDLLTIHHLRLREILFNLFYIDNLDLFFTSLDRRLRHWYHRRYYHDTHLNERVYFSFFKDSVYDTAQLKAVIRVNNEFFFYDRNSREKYFSANQYRFLPSEFAKDTGAWFLFPFLSKNITSESIKITRSIPKDTFEELNNASLDGRSSLALMHRRILYLNSELNSVSRLLCQLTGDEYTEPPASTVPRHTSGLFDDRSIMQPIDMCQVFYRVTNISVLLDYVLEFHFSYTSDSTIDRERMTILIVTPAVLLFYNHFSLTTASKITDGKTLRIVLLLFYMHLLTVSPTSFSTSFISGFSPVLNAILFSSLSILCIQTILSSPMMSDLTYDENSRLTSSGVQVIMASSLLLSSSYYLLRDCFNQVIDYIFSQPVQEDSPLVTTSANPMAM